MIIEVRECDEVVFNGDADEFLFMKDNDIELIKKLNRTDIIIFDENENIQM